ncbi:hypothetical protein CIPAW_11G056800 [Carya illinoinensis]|uniref:ADP-ribosyl cyclase/cyclic ADP-ribose hydrolase n=2 Tax=Carya illinoinensis TaxID=32201 RepID=A0A8T1NYV0_CARIL|nr:hypothetical protein CIPAW_11G056800 [Carya illinoinensis]
MASTTINVQSALGTSLSSTSNDSSTWSEPQICREYDVFLNFRGEDTRYTFTDHLYNALVDKCIRTFKDNEELAYGKPIKRELLDAIDKPRMAVIILSKDYASSTWCLEELAKIVERMEDRGMRVLPIFYHVDPRDVQNQTETFASAFDEHGNHFKDQNIEKVKMWRDALKRVANLSEHYLKDG